MKIISNDKKISRNSTIGFWSSLISPALLLFSAFSILNNPAGFQKVFPIFALGIVLYQIGLSFRKYGRRSDREFNKILSKLDNKYSIFQFKSPVPHLLVGPAGIWILLPKYAKGLITFNQKRKRWKLKRESFLDKFFFFISEGLGRPDNEILRQADVLDYHLQKNWDRKDNIQVNAVGVIMHEKSKINKDEFPIPTIHINKLRGFLREKEKENKIPISTLKAFQDLFK